MPLCFEHMIHISITFNKQMFYLLFKIADKYNIGAEKWDVSLSHLIGT